MSSVSAAYKAILANPATSRQYTALITIYLDSGNLTIQDAAILAGSLRLSESMAAGNELSIGNTVMSTLTFTLLNLNGEYDDLQITNKTIRVQIGLTVSGAPEYVDLGYFIVTSAPAKTKTIQITSYDRMTLAERG